MSKINMVTIASLKPTGKRQFIRDSVLVGFGIEGSAKGKFTYFVETRVKGVQKGDLLKYTVAEQFHRTLFASY